ncbi:hypothetical protein [Hymenobacter crusticola]|uniref:Uncharacterized protein n=1 Tax=Hymenobacter crusticola TaxID=1770526 RepID=A0A2C9ZTY3_9BACT|nr:hypothetical protein [Hymenobacter crusticola]OUJ70171.1 hypothetical protein BXP70_25310 [Hymenobacter crusticola]
MPQKAVFKAPNNEKLRQFAHAFVQSEINMQLGEEGLDACFIIGIQLERVLPAYRKYADIVSQTNIRLERVKDHFGEHWYKLSNGQRRTLEAFIRSDAEVTGKQIEAHIKYLETYQQHMASFGPNGQKELQKKIAQVLGWSMQEEEQGAIEHEEGIAA